MNTALVTGASRGLGEAIASALILKGYSVVKPTREELDLNSPDSIEAFSFKYGKLDVLVNNAAVIGETLEEAIAVNALGAYRLTKKLWPLLSDKYTQGCVINISSREGLSEHFGNRNYSVSKYTLNAITRMLSNNDDGVSVAACCPGWFRSRLGGELAQQSAKQAADTPVWLATEASDFNGKFFINRQVVPW